MSRVDLGLLGETRQPLERVEEILGALARLDREVGSRRVADQQRVAGEQVTLDEEAAVLGPVAGGVQDADRDRAEAQLVAVGERLVGELRLGQRVDGDGKVVLEREPAVAGDVVGVRVRLENANDAYAAALGLRELGLDCVGGIDDHGLAGCLVADQVGRTAEVVVHELAKEHVACDRTKGRR
ncbi:MAG: hypothetical protein QOG06_2587 [Gaiellaceae bacterium]|nr:hypothetical protein [Gaiellaceae bacterium]